MHRIRIYFLTFFLAFFFTTSAITKNSYFAEGEKLFNEKKYSKSKFKFEKDIVFNPKNEKSYLYLAKIFQLEENDEFEEKNLNTVILLNPKNEEAVYFLALLKIKKSDYEKSKELIDRFKKVCKTFCEKEKELKTKLESLQPK